VANIPNTTTPRQFLRSVGDGSNSSFWLATLAASPTASGSVGTSGNIQQSSTLTPLALTSPLNQTVSGFTTYLAVLNMTVTQNDTGGDHDIVIQIAFDGTLVGYPMRQTCGSTSGGQKYYSMSNSFTVVAGDTGTHTISGYAAIVSAATYNGTALRAVLSIVGIA
jgi:hypothetical protein